MHASTLELMYDHVRAIYRVLTGNDPPELPAGARAEGAPSAEAVARRFADLEMAARSISIVAERLPPFSFVPPFDVIGSERELLIEVGVPGVTRSDITIELEERVLVISGTRAGQQEFDGRTLYHCEIPRGPFRRVLRLPLAVSGDPRVEVEHGIIRIRLTKAISSRPASA